MSKKKWDELGDLFMCSSPATKANPPKDFFLLCIKKDKDSYYDTSLIFSKQESGDPIKIEKWKLDKLHEIMKTKPISQKTLTKMLNNPENWITEKWLLANKKYLGLFPKKEEGTLASVRLDQTNSFFPNLVDQAPDSNKDKWNSIPSSYLFLALNAKGHYQLCYKKRKGGWSYEVIPEAVFVKMPNRKNILDTLKPYLPKDLLKKVQMPEVVITTEWLEAKVRKVDFSFKPLKKRWGMLSYSSIFLTTEKEEITGVGLKDSDATYQWLPIETKGHKMLLFGKEIKKFLPDSEYMKKFFKWPSFDIQELDKVRAVKERECALLRSHFLCEKDLSLLSSSELKKEWANVLPYSWFLCYDSNHRIDIGVKVTKREAYFIRLPIASVIETAFGWALTKKGVDLLKSLFPNKNVSEFIPPLFGKVFPYGWISANLSANFAQQEGYTLEDLPFIKAFVASATTLLWDNIKTGSFFYEAVHGVCKKHEYSSFTPQATSDVDIETIPYLNLDCVYYHDPNADIPKPQQTPFFADKEKTGYEETSPSSENKEDTDLCYIGGRVCQCIKEKLVDFETGKELSYVELYDMLISMATPIKKSVLVNMIKENLNAKK